MLLSATASLFGGSSAQTSPVETERAYAHVLYVIDGDTIDVQLNGSRERIRYIGIDTPEIAHEGREAECFAEEARNANRALVEGKRVQLVADDQDRDQYNRFLRYVYVDGLMVNEQLIKAGAAVTLPIPPNTKYYEEFNTAEQLAKEEQKGKWSSCI